MLPRNYGPFPISQLIDRNSVKLKLLAHFRMHPVIHVEHTRPHYDQPDDLRNETEIEKESFMGENGVQEFMFKK